MKNYCKKNTANKLLIQRYYYYHYGKAQFALGIMPHYVNCSHCTKSLFNTKIVLFVRIMITVS